MAHPSRRLRLWPLGLLGLGALSSSGCATCVMLGGAIAGSEPDLATPYSGLRLDWGILSADASAPHGWGDMPVFVRVLSAIDAPLSFALDTACLPVTIVVWALSPAEREADAGADSAAEHE